MSFHFNLILFLFSSLRFLSFRRLTDQDLFKSKQKTVHALTYNVKVHAYIVILWWNVHKMASWIIFLIHFAYTEWYLPELQTLLIETNRKENCFFCIYFSAIFFSFLLFCCCSSEFDLMLVLLLRIDIWFYLILSMHERN